MADINLKTKRITNLGLKTDPTGMRFAVYKDPSAPVGHDTYCITYEDLKAQLSADLA